MALTLSRRQALVSLAAGAFEFDARAQPAAHEPLHLIAPSPPGGFADIHCRRLSERIGRELSQPVVVDNRPGANGILAADQLAKARPDGQTIGMIGTSDMINAALRRLPYDTLRDLAPLATGVRGAPLLLVHPALPARSFEELLAHLRARPNELTYGSPGIGSPPHLVMEILALQKGLKLVHVPYKGANEVVTDLIGGRIQLAVLYGTSVMPAIQAGQMRPLLAVGGKRRKPLLPDVPTAAEAGVPEFDGTAWFGFAAPSGTPPARQDELHRALVTALRVDDYVEWVGSLGSEVVAGSPLECAQWMAADIERFRAVVRSTGLRLE